MKTLLRLEELAQFLACLLLLVMNAVPWWAYLLLLLGPDIGMLGYLVNTRVGGFTYNLFHHKAVALLLCVAGLSFNLMPPLGYQASLGDMLVTTAIILYGHSSMDRALGYDLKFGDHFQHTHLGWIGKRSSE